MRFTVKSILSSSVNNQGLRRYFFNTSWMFVEQVLRIIAGLFVGIWVARYLGPEKFGLFSYALAFVALFDAVAKLGLDGIMVRQLVNYHDKRDVYLGTAFWLKLAGAILTLIVIAAILPFTSNDAITNIYIYIIASGLILQSFQVIDFYFKSQVLAKYISICKIVQLALSSLLKLYLIFIHADLIWFVLISLVDQATLAISLSFAYWKKKLPAFYRVFDRSLARKLLKDSWPLIFSGFAVMVYMRIDQIMIKEMLGERDVGLYSAAVKLSEAWYFVPIIITTSLFPAILNAKKISQDLYYRRLQSLYTLIIWIAIVVALSVTLMSDWLIIILYGSNYRGAGATLSVLVWAGLFVGIGVANGNWFLSENLQHLSTKNTFIGAFANVIINYFLIPLYGILGAAFATILSYGIAAYLALLFNKNTRNSFFAITKSIVHIPKL